MSGKNSGQCCKNSNKALDKLKSFLYTSCSDYFFDGYTYKLTRVKYSPEINSEDFKEWNDEDVEELVEYLIEEIKKDDTLIKLFENNEKE